MVKWEKKPDYYLFQFDIAAERLLDRMETEKYLRKQWCHFVQHNRRKTRTKPGLNVDYTGIKKDQSKTITKTKPRTKARVNQV